MKNPTKLLYFLFLSLGVFLSTEKNAVAQSVTFNYTGSLQTWTVPACVTSITVVAKGAEGGSNNHLGGDGAIITATFRPTPGHTLDIAVGNVGQSGVWDGGGGGGGTFVWDNASTTLPLIAAGGGGGGGYTTVGNPGSTTSTPTTVAGHNGAGGAGGTAGALGLNVPTGAGGGGGGWLTAATVAPGPDKGGIGAGEPDAFAFGLGATAGSVVCNGGYGGGGGGGYNPTSTYGAGGGGGGYNGGGGGDCNSTTLQYGGGGGGSYVNASGTTVSTAATNTTTGSVTITYTTAVAITASVTSNVTCRGGSNGSILATVTAGIAPYTYLWAPSGGSNATATGLIAGTYTITVTDGCGISATASATVTQPNILVVTATATTNVTCPGGNNGSALATPSGGTSAYAYSWSPSGETTNPATGLTAGTYTVTVNDACGSSATASVTITQPINPLATSAAVVANVSCNGGSNGSVSAIVTGGGPPYTYSWSPSGETTNPATGLTAGGYTVTVNDACGASVSASVTITQPLGPLSVSANTTANVLCNGGSNGSASSTTSGGTGPYTYSWSPSGGNTDTATGLTSGTYILNVTDNHGCTASASTIITQPNVLSVSVNTTANVSCNGGSNGSASSATSGGTMPYTYSWSPAGGSTDTATGLTAGTYTLSITDNDGCTASASTIITQPIAALSVSANTTMNILCNGGSNGSVSSATSGGTGPYIYSWAPSGGTNDTAFGLTAGTYTLNVTDNHGCTASASTIITQPNILMATGNVVANISCFGENNGGASAIMSGGSMPFTYSWSNGETMDTATGLTAGIYRVIVIDNDGCSTSTSVSITQPNPVFANTNITSSATCGISNGSITSTAGGGTAPYTYSWTGGGTNSSISGLSGGTYVLNVVDNNGCSVSLSATITETPAVNVLVNTSSNVTCSGESDGSAVSSVTGGTAPFMYAWSNGETNFTDNGLTAGTYTVNVTDANGCTSSAETTVNEPPPITVIADSTADNGNCSGSVGLVVTGGVSPYTYTWSDGNTNDYVDGVCSGTYCCIIEDANGCKKDVCVTVKSTTGINKIISGSGQITVYPNPNNGQFTIQSSVGSGQLSVEVYNVLGEKVFGGNLNPGNNTINMSNQSNGVYLYRVLSENGTLVSEGKIMLQK